MTDQPAAKRIRLARIYADLSRPELAQKLNTSATTITRMELGTRPVSLEELLAIGEACDVSSVFMREGFTPEDSVESKVQALWEQVQLISQQLEAMQDTMERMYRRGKRTQSKRSNDSEPTAA